MRSSRVFRCLLKKRILMAVRFFGNIICKHVLNSEKENEGTAAGDLVFLSVG